MFTNSTRFYSLLMSHLSRVGWLWMALSFAPAASPSTTFHQSFLLHGHMCVLPTQHGDISAPAFLGGAKNSAGRCQFCLAAFWPDRERKQMSPISESKDSQKMALGAAGHTDGFPMAQEKRHLGGRRRGRR